MANSECIIDDAYCTRMGAYFKAQGETLDQMVVDYLAVIRAVRSEAITKGDVAKSLDIYIDYAKKLQNQIGMVSASAQSQVSGFLSRVDEADKYLF